MKYLFILFAGFSLSIVAAQKTAFINESQVLEATPGYAEALKETQDLKKQYNQEILEAKQKLDDKANELMKNYNLTSETTQEQLLAMLSEKDKAKYELLLEEQKLLQQQLELKEKSYQAIYQEKVGVILDDLNEKIKKYCKKNKIQILYKKEVMNNGLIYLEEDLNITQDIIDLMKE